MSEPFYEDGDVPPSYNEAVAPAAGSNHGGGGGHDGGLYLPPAVTSSFTSPLSAHLQSLPARMRATQAARSTERAAQDLELITLLVPHVETFLSELGSMGWRTPPVVAELTLVPASAVPRGAAMSGAAQRRREGDFVRVVRVEAGKRDTTNINTSEKGGGGGGGQVQGSSNSTRNYAEEEEDDDDDGRNSFLRPSEPGFDEWGRFDTEPSSSSGDNHDTWFFHDEAMAHRLANYLRPEPNLDRRHIQAAVAGVRPSSGSGWRWGRKKQTPAATTQPTPAAPVRQQVSPLLQPGETERASMTVRAEEVTFRKENDFGIWETITGYGIVVAVRVRR
ncbi:hypothetical protein B0H66DRAFT_485386 [Apodospora peruviana]|uniref:Uncharacterized protein n=1 Tax=Apodospora peruviana TaxID=516989 RepID=A0AAE0LYT8_9PEZI|nr:hypothetical protein B0H66DRAFT_485386 [Apodospora peruviana]